MEKDLATILEKPQLAPLTFGTNKLNALFKPEMPLSLKLPRPLFSL
jgi:hypothetical protein